MTRHTLEDPAGAGVVVVRAEIGLADRRRRQRNTSRELWRAAPLVAAVSLGVAIAGRWAGGPPILPLSVLGAGILGLAVRMYLNRRDHAISDTVAAGIDADAGLGGELRSASWFAAGTSRDDWTDFHLDRATERIRAVEWTLIYPTVRAPRARLASSVMAIGAIALAITVPSRGLRGEVQNHLPPAGALQGQTPDPSVLLSPELQRQLEDLLAAAEAGALSTGEQPLNAAALRDLLALLSQLHDAKALKDLARAMDPSGDHKPDQAAKELKALAERAKRAGLMAALLPEVREALENLAEKLSEAAKAEQMANKDPRDAVGSQDAQQGDAAKASASADVDEVSIQSVQDAGAGGGPGVLMVSKQDAAKGEAGAGVGGGASNSKSGGGTMPDLAQTLLHETVEASTDNPGENVLTDARHETEQGHAAVTYTRGAAGTSDRSRAAASSAVPEGRRTAVHTYFIRKQ